MLMQVHPETATVRDTVIHNIVACLQAANRPVPEIRDDVDLSHGLSLSSLDLATLIAMLEEATGRDPFLEHTSITSVRTVGDLVKAYIHFA